MNLAIDKRGIRNCLNVIFDGNFLYLSVLIRVLQLHEGFRILPIRCDYKLYTALKVKHRLNIFQEFILLSKHEFILGTFMKIYKVVTIYSIFIRLSLR